MSPKDTSNLPVPESASGITSDWLQAALQPVFGDLEIEGVSAERIGEVYGLASQIYRVSWASGAPPHSVILKLWRTDGVGGRREIDFYRTFAEPILAWIPTCYYSGIDSKTERGLLILEDLAPAAQGDCLGQMNLKLAQAAADGLAGIHAAWFKKDTLKAADWLPDVSTWNRDSDWFEPRRNTFLERFGDRLDQISRNVLDQIEKAQSIANVRLEKAPVTLLHEDLHLDNYVFLNGERPVLLDWARCARGPLVLDLYELLFSMSEAKDRQIIFETYLAAFKDYACQELSPGEIFRQMGGAFLRKYAIATCGIANWVPASMREAKMIDKGLERAFIALEFWQKQDPDLFSFLDK